MGEWTKNRLPEIAFLPQPHATSPREKWLAVKVCEATAKGGSTLTDRQLFTTIQNWWGCNDKGSTVRIFARACRLPAALAAPRRIARASPLLRRRRTAATVAVMPRRGFIKTAPAIRVRNDSREKLGLFEPYGACSTATRKCKQSHRDNKRALAAHGGTYRASDNCALRRSCGDGLRACRLRRHLSRKR